MFITASSTISYQPTFRNKGFSSMITELNDSSKLITPDYSAFIPPMERRRMSDVLKMAITCSLDCLGQAEIEQPDGIIVGTSMGCSIHTKNFLDKIYSANEGPLSPTSFIVSTHNTIAGQISLLLKNHGYNMTHTQNSLSFEQALIDGMLFVDEGNKNVLVGAADEEEDDIYNMKARLGLENIYTTCGTSFFVLSDQKRDSDDIALIDVKSFGLINDFVSIINAFLDSNYESPENIDHVLYCSNDRKRTEELKKIFGEKKISDYQKYSGIYFTNSAFAMSYGIDILSFRKHPEYEGVIRKVLICNNVIPENLGLILLGNKTE